MSASDILPLLQSIAARLTIIESKMGASGSSDLVAGEAQVVVADVPRSIKGFDSYCTTHLDPFVAACSKLSGDADAAGKLVNEAWLEMRAFLLMASKCKEPPAASLNGLLGGVAAKMREINALTKRNEYERHLKTITEGLGCLSWLAVKPAPRDFIESFIGGSDYWANNIRREFRSSNPDQIAFCDTFKALLTELMAYVKEFHTTGVQWNAKGIDVTAYTPGEDPSPSSSSSSAPAAVAAPAPTPTAAAASPAKASGGGGSAIGNIFSSLTKGEAITSGLKTVTKDMQTWRSEYKGKDAPTPAAPVVPKRAAATQQVKGPPKLEFQPATSKWMVENQSEVNGTVSVDITEVKQTVYIFGCIGANISINGKCKSIVVDSCKKTAVYFDTAISSCEVVNSARIQIHCREKVASVAIDKTDGIVVNLPLSSLDATVVASKSSEMNISWPDANGDLIERPIPEQYVHKINGMSITADVSDLYGH